ncbi:MAG: ABC transporter permease [Gemmatimonadota bacterium]|nr:MAG: ABC transporter permease [Gemmatimonadota bacterium]
MKPRGPRVADAVLGHLLPDRHREAVLGDLAEEFQRHVLPERGRLGAHLWYWLQLARSIWPTRLRTAPVAKQPGPRHKGDGFMIKTLSDLKYAARSLRKTPGFTLIVLITMALGIGANTAIFSVVYSVLLAPFPYPEANRIVQIWTTTPERGWFFNSPSEPNFWDLEERSQSFEHLAAYRGGSANLTGGEFPERIRAAQITAEFLQTLGVAPIMGRDFLPDEDDIGADGRVVLLSNQFWRTNFGSDPSAVGGSISLDDVSHTIVGVLPHDGMWLENAQVFRPLVRNPNESRANNILSVIGRLRQGISSEMALPEMQAAATQLAEQYPESNEGMGINFAPASRWRANSQVRTALWVLMGAVGFLLLIACVNLANLMLARATSRRREIAVCAALGAGRGRIAGRILTESAILAGAGAAAGLLLAYGAIHLLRAVNTTAIPRVAEVGVNGWVLGFTLLVGIITAALSGLLPAVQTPRDGSPSVLREGERGILGSRSQDRLRQILVGAEVALALVLLVGAGLMIRSFGRLQRVDFGFSPDNRLTFSVNVPQAANRNEHVVALQQFLTEFLGGLNSAPQVRSAAAVSWRPLDASTTNMGVWDASGPHEEESVVLADFRHVTPGYLRTMGLSLLKGRDLNDQDLMYPLQNPPWSVIVSEALSATLWPGGDPIGQQITLWSDERAVGTVVGVVENMRERGLEQSPTRAVYLPYFGAGWSPVHFVVHTAGDPTQLVPQVRTQLADINPILPVYDIDLMDNAVADSMAGRQFNTVLMAAFSIVALLLALAGVYGVLAYSVSRRTSEIGVRVALGASPQKVLSHVIRGGMIPVLVGMLIGLAGAFGLSRLMQGMLFGVTASDPITYVSVALILASAAIISCYVPARRAVRIDPVAALRED